MKYLITTILCFLTCSVYAGINEKELTSYVMKNINESYTKKKKSSNYNHYYYSGKLDAFKSIFHAIKMDFQEEINPELNAKIHQLEDGTMMIEYYGCKFSCYPEHLKDFECKADLH